MAIKKKHVETPLMKQYYAIKEKHPDAILLFRVGDFYETFGDDAIKASEILGITLTKRANGSAQTVELAGFPHHAIDTYMPKLVRAGQRVAVCEQLEDPKKTKKIVKRGITELVTPGVSINDNILDHSENNFLASVFLHKKGAGVAFLDISTGEFMATEGSFHYIDKLLNSFQPKEVLFQRGKDELFTDNFGKSFYTFMLDDWVYSIESASDRLKRHFEVTSMKGFGIHAMDHAIIAAGAILHYLDLTEHHHVKHISNLARIEEDRHMWLDRFTIRNLELLQPLSEGAKTLIQVMDKTTTPMGARMLKRWVSFPLKDVEPIKRRHDVVESFINDEKLFEEVQHHISKLGDLERIISKVAVQRINPREVVQLKYALQAIVPIKALCEKSENETLKHFAEQLNPCKSIADKIEKEIFVEPSNQINKGNVVNHGVSSELDELRDIKSNGKEFLVEMQRRESERTGIPSLKIAFNNVFGYYLEVRNTHKDKVPEEWIRKQTLVNAERYITEELKGYEAKIMGAEEKILAIEFQIFNDLVFALSDYIQAIQLNSNILSQIDCLLSFAKISEANEYTRPEINDGHALKITNGRHPVIEQQLPDGESYIANSVELDNKNQQVIIITGPNMSGKSALLRQTALIVLMAQTGCFVPAEGAEIGYIDKIFTRVGASDNISLGESTFMVEMNEAASILNNMSERSLILLDELGRGTSTYDGISIAWSIVEHIHEQKINRAKTLFATHYHELNEMEKGFKRVRNYNVTVKEVGNKVIFLRKLVRGGSNHSFGIHVARMAGMPKSLVKRSEEILKQLEGDNRKDSLAKPLDHMGEERDGYQLSFFQLDDPVLSQIREEISNIDINNLTPMEALNKLNEIKKISGL